MKLIQIYHFTRASLRSESSKGVRVYGILLGKQVGRKVEVCYSSEMIIDGENIIEAEYMTTRLEQCGDGVFFLLSHFVR